MPQYTPRRVTLVIAAALAAAACERRAPPLFEPLAPAATGVTFVNAVPEEDTTLNIVNFLNYYDGGGVAAGDVDGDGRPDLYFTSNLGPNRLYRNKGNYQFEDITERAGVADPEGWKTGVTMADVNGDGRLDIYVCAITYLTMRGQNVLYINNGDGTFTDRTKEYGLAHAGYSTQAAFFDYDGDGDLDMYLLNYSAHTERGPSARPQREPRHPLAGDRLFRNDGKRFTDVSAQAGIYGGVEGYGLGVVASDLNLDGCPDVYVANDFQENDFLYVNNCDGTFTEALTAAMPHTSRSSMGVDAADFNNDGRPDVVVLDMLPEREDVLKTSATVEDEAVFRLKLRAGYHPQYARNTLQLNRGSVGGAVRFSEIGYLAGVHATDWSWAPLFADFDNDGHKDLFVTNGISRRPNDLDYYDAYMADPVMKTAPRTAIPRAVLRRLLNVMPHVPLPNYAFRGNGDLTFTNMAEAWGLGQPGFSNGAVYVDLNSSGALDLVVNDLNAPAAIYRNRAREIGGNHYLRVVLRGSGANTAGIGAKVVIKHDGRTQLLEQMPTRGFQSSVDPVLHFGLGPSTRLDSLIVIWPDRRLQVLTDVQGDQTITLRQGEAAGAYGYRGRAGQPLFTDATAGLGISFEHEENDFVDYTRQPLMPHLLSTEGPALAVGDVNGDGLDDIYAGGAMWQTAQLLVQQRDGTFRARNQPLFAADRVNEDVDATFFDANGDGHPDLYVVSGGNELSAGDPALQDRLYLNDGRGTFQRAPLPVVTHNGACVVPGDFDGDGDLDLFVGRRVVSGGYGLIPPSYLLQNDGTGHFTDVTGEKAPALSAAGMLTSAAWLDYDGDGHLDLIVAGEWTPVRVLRQERGRFEDRTAQAGLAGTNGWWNSVTAADLNGDGRQDLVLGNLGLNSYLQASRQQPVRLYVHDFFANGTLEQVLTLYKQGVSYPLAGRDELLRVLPQLRGKYSSYAAFGASRIEDILPAAQLRRASVLRAETFASSTAINDGHGRFDLRPLPIEAQFAPIRAVLADDFDGDGQVDLLVAGNLYGVPPVLGRYDAGYGLLLRGSGDGRFAAVDMEESGLVIQGQVRHLALLRRAGGERLIVVARNDDTLQILR